MSGLAVPINDVFGDCFPETPAIHSPEEAVQEARRCVNCRHKLCVSGCPLGIDIPLFMRKVAEGKFAEAYAAIAGSNPLPAICGHICPSEAYCERRCTAGGGSEPAAIGRLERFVVDYHYASGKKLGVKLKPNGHKVAVIGAGPAGLSCAAELARRGYAVTVFEAFSLAGGILMYGIPQFLLPKALVQREIESLKQLGVDFRTNVPAGQILKADQLLREYGFQAVYIASGAKFPRFLNIPGIHCKGVYSAGEYLTRLSLPDNQADGIIPVYNGEKVVVVGGDHAAVRAARFARRLGAEVTLAYRRTEKDLRAPRQEIQLAKQEGVVLMSLTDVLSVNEDENGWVSSIRCQEMFSGPPDETGRSHPVPLYESDFIIDTDCVILSADPMPDPLFPPGAAVYPEKGVYTYKETSIDETTVILDMAAGKSAAAAIDENIGDK